MPAPHLRAAGNVSPARHMGATYDAVPPGFEAIMPQVGEPLGNGALVVKADQAAFLTTWIASFIAPKLILSTAPISISDNSLLTDFAEPTATWYAPLVVTFGTPYIDPSDGMWHVPLEVAGWNYSGASPACDIYAFGLTDTF